MAASDADGGDTHGLGGADASQSGRNRQLVPVEEHTIERGRNPKKAAGHPYKCCLLEAFCELRPRVVQ